MRPDAPRHGALLAAILALAAWTAAPAALAAPGPQEDIERGLMCYCGCANLTVRDCSCGTAAKIKADIAARLQAGQTPDQVVAAYVAEHGEQIRSEPERSGFNLMAWIMPFAAIAAGAVLIVGLTRRWHARGQGATAPGPDRAAPPGVPGADPADREALDRVAREMRENL